MANNQQLLMGEGAGGAPVVYIEDVFSTYLYTGNGSTQTITNNIDLSTKGGLVWIKDRGDTWQHTLTDSARGVGQYLGSNITNGQQPWNADAPTFTSTGLTIPVNGGVPYTNYLTNRYVSWTFRKQPKFFDIVTYTGNGVAGRTIAHTLGSVPGCIIVKRTDTTADWAVYHRSLANTQYLVLNSTAAATTGATWWNSTTPTSAVFSVGTDASVNASGGTYVAYIFAHDAGGFGLAGTDNVISCGTFTNNTTVTLGYEPQFVMVKRTDNIGNWFLLDQMRGIATDGNDALLFANLSDAEDTANNFLNLTATGFSTLFGNGTFIYIAIRRGPMKVPTVGTSVFSPIAKTGDASTTTITNVGFPADLFMFKWTALAYGWKQQDRLRGFVQKLASDQTGSESNSGTYTFGTVNNTGYTYGANASTAGELNGSGVTSSVLAFGRAPGFFDVVCYTGTGSATTFSHNLGVVPEMMIVKNRSSAGHWIAYHSGTGNTKYLRVSSDVAVITDPVWNNTTPTATVFSVGSGAPTNSVDTLVAYLFATCAGVSKVGSYTGNGSNQTIACGFTAGSRFVLIKRTDSTGDWYVWDSARGIIAGNDPHLSLNTTAAEVTTDDSVDTDNSGFIVNQVAATNVNVTSATYIFLAIA